ncbi:hypothetical protein FRC12_000742 [Ceratobasidium sp. 428]|nr:hypothetical protein FRC12_000742 [Ceratobasidium sp. 428]
MSSGNIDDIFNQWKVAHDHLTQATQTFFDTCVALLQFIDESPAGYARDISIEDAVIGVNNRMKNLPAVRKRVGDSQIVLRKVINTSTTLIPVNVLPLEVMSRVFTLVASKSACIEDRSYRLSRKPDCRPYQSHPLVVIPSVCARWRRLVIGTPSLWSHVDVDSRLIGENDVNVLPRTRLWLERARGARLSLHIGAICQKSGSGWDLLSLLESHMVNLASLKFSRGSGAYFWPILNLYADIYPLGSLTSLSMSEAFGTDLVTDSFVWPVSALRGLTSLELHGLCTSKRPSMTEFVTMLANSPALHTLHLKSMELRIDSHYSYTEIKLPCLRLLQLEDMGDHTLSNLFSSLVPGPLELDVRLRLDRHVDKRLRTAITSFFNRTNITCLSLSVGTSSDSKWLAEQLSCVPRLRVLALENSDRFGSWASLDILTLPIEGDKFEARCPNLRLLWINGGFVNLGAYTQLKRIASCHQLSALVFGDRATLDEVDGNEAIEWLRQRVGSVILRAKTGIWNF